MEKPKTINQRVKSWLVLPAKLLAWSLPFLLVNQANAQSLLDRVNPLNQLAAGLDLILQLLGGIILVVLGLTGSFVMDISSKFINSALISGGNDFIFSPQIQTAWGSILQGSNVLLFLSLGIMSIMIITGMQNYNLKKAVSGLIYAILMANFSYSIVRLLVLLGDALRVGLSAGLGIVSGETSPYEKFYLSLGQVFSMPDISSPSETLSAGLYSLLSSVIAGLMIAIGAFAMARIAILLLERVVRIALYIVFAPLVFILQLFPGVGLDSLSKSWWADLVKWILVLPAVYFLLNIAGILLPDINFTQQVLNSVTGDETVTGTDFWTNLLLAASGIFVLYSAGNIGQMMKLSPLLSNAAPVKWFANLPNMAVKSGTQGVKNALTLGGQNLALQTGLAGTYEGMKQGWQRKFGKPMTEQIKANRERLGQIKDSTTLSSASAMQPKLKEEYDKALESFQRNNSMRLLGKRFEDLTDDDKNTLEDANAFKNSAVARNFAANKKILAAEAAKLKVGYSERDFTADEAVAEYKKLKGLVKTMLDKNPRADVSEYALKMRGLLDLARSRAIGGGANAVPWKDFLNDFSLDASNEDARSAIKNVGGNIPKDRYTYSEKEERDYRSRNQSLSEPEAKQFAELLKSQRSYAVGTRELSTKLNKVSASAIPTKIKDAVSKLGSLGDKSLVNAVVGTNIRSLTNSSLLREIDLSTTSQRDISLALRNRSTSSVQKIRRIEEILQNEHSTFSDEDRKLVAESIVTSDGSVLTHASTISDIIDGLNTSARDDVNDVITLAGSTAKVPLPDTKDLDQLERKVGHHDGYIAALGKAEDMDTIAEKAAEKYLSISSDTYIDPVTSRATEASKLTSAELIDRGMATEAEIKEEHDEIIKRLGISTGTVKGKADLDISNFDKYKTLNVTQRRDILTKVMLSHRAIVERKGAPLPPKKS